MPATPAHTLHAHESHSGWDRDLPPQLTVSPGTTVRLEAQDASGGQLDRSSDATNLESLDFGRINPTTGPVYVDGARPGDALAVRIEALEPSDWGWTANIPGFGLLADDFPKAALHHWDLAHGSLAHYGDVARIPIRPFPGTLGVAPDEPGPHSVVPPRRVGGNMDTRDLAAGTTVWLPVEVEGALFSLGDTHAAQGDGEVCGTAIESAMAVDVTLDLVREAAPPAPVFETVRAQRDGEDRDGVLATTGVGPDLLEGARDAVRSMIDLLGQRRGLEPVEAYLLCSVAADLRISEVVDQPNWVVTCAIPRAILA